MAEVGFAGQRLPMKLSSNFRKPDPAPNPQIVKQSPPHPFNSKKRREDREWWEDNGDSEEEQEPESLAEPASISPKFALETDEDTMPDGWGDDDDLLEPEKDNGNASDSKSDFEGAWGDDSFDIEGDGEEGGGKEEEEEKQEENEEVLVAAFLPSSLLPKSLGGIVSTREFV